MELINVYRQALQNTSINDLSTLNDEKIILHSSMKIYLRRICFNNSWKEYRLEILLMNDNCIMSNKITEEEYEELYKLTHDKITNLTTDFLNQKYTSFPQAPEELQNEAYNKFN